MQPYDLTQLELRHLLALQAVARSGTFWGAAEDMGCSQSALSQQIAAMERLLGVTLIDRHRGKRTVSTTEAGRLLLRHAEVIVARMRAVRADFTAFTQGAAGLSGQFKMYQLWAVESVPAPGWVIMVAMLG